MKNNLTSSSARLDQEAAAIVTGRKRPERLTKNMKTRQDIYGRIEDGRQSRICYPMQTQNRVYKGHSRPQDGRGQQSTMPLLYHLSIRRYANKLRTRERT
jgi:hypothetical protein